MRCERDRWISFVKTNIFSFITLIIVLIGFIAWAGKLDYRVAYIEANYVKKEQFDALRENVTDIKTDTKTLLNLHICGTADCK